MNKIIFKIIIYICIGLALLSFLAPFIEIPIIDDALEKFNNEYPIVSGIVLIAIGFFLLIHDIKDGHPIKSFRIGDRIRNLVFIGIGLFQIVNISLNH